MHCSKPRSFRSDQAKELARLLAPLLEPSRDEGPKEAVASEATIVGCARRLESHPAIRHDFVNIFGNVLPNRSMLKFLIKNANAERLRWEALCEAPGRFMAVSDTCVISRVTPAKVGPGLRSFVYPLRMAAFLSAAGVKAEPELERFANRF
jgi:hypothetical protein